MDRLMDLTILSKATDLPSVVFLFSLFCPTCLLSVDDQKKVESLDSTS